MRNQNNTCPICGEGDLHERIEQEEVEYNGKKGNTSLYYSECDVCGSEQADATQIRNNRRSMIAFKKKVDGLLTGKKIKEIRTRLGITQRQAAAIFGGGTVAFSKYENDDVMQSESMDNLLYAVNRNPELLYILAERRNIQLPRPKQQFYLPTLKPANSPEYMEEPMQSSDRKRQSLHTVCRSTLAATPAY